MKIITYRDAVKLLENYKEKCGIHINSRHEDETRHREIDDVIEALETGTIVMPQIDDLKERFDKLKSRWKTETRFISSLTMVATNYHYLKIIGLGKEVIPLILHELTTDPDHWFHALRALTAEDPVSSEHRGDFQAMTEAWLNWGKRRGLIQ